MTLRDIVVAAIGALIAGGVAIFLDQRRRKDERKNRFLDEKRRVYRDFLHYSDLLFHDMMLMASFMPTLQRLESGNTDPTAVKQARQLVNRIEPNLRSYEQQLFHALTELSLLGPMATGEPAKRMGQMVKKLTEYADNGEVDKLPALQADYERARDEFGVAARLDLGTPL